MTADFTTAITSGPYWAAVLATMVLTSLTVGLQYEVLERLNYSMPRWKRVPPRLRVLGMIVVLLGLHVAEIWIYGIGIFCATRFPELGFIAGGDGFNLLDAVYMAATTYSTLGFGDLVPHGPIRFLIGTEALVGLMMITWSASFTYLEMQRYWRDR